MCERVLPVRPRSLLFAGIILCAAIRTPLLAQEARVAAAGSRVRVSIPGVTRRWPFGDGSDNLEGSVSSISVDTLYLVLSRAMSPIAIPRSSIRRVEISLGPSPRGHAVLGGIVGAAILGLRMYVVDQEPNTQRFPAHWQAGAVGGALGFAVGAWIGARVPNERWRVVRLPD